MTDRATQILAHPRAQRFPRLAAHLAHETRLDVPVAIAALAGAVRDLDADAPAASSTDERAAIEALGPSIFESRRQAATGDPA
jgi:hypothetical protein